MERGETCTVCLQKGHQFAEISSFIHKKIKFIGHSHNIDISQHSKWYICNICLQKLDLCCHFKQMLVETEDKILRMDRSNRNPRNLKILVGYSDDLGEDAEICRFCLKNFSLSNIAHHLYKEKNQAFESIQKMCVDIFDMDLSLSKEPKICISCGDCLKKTHDFIKLVIETRQAIDSFIKKNQFVNITSDILEFIEKNEIVSISDVDHDNSQTKVDNFEMTKVKNEAFLEEVRDENNVLLGGTKIEIEDNVLYPESSSMIFKKEGRAGTSILTSDDDTMERDNFNESEMDSNSMDVNSEHDDSFEEYRDYKVCTSCLDVDSDQCSTCAGLVIIESISVIGAAEERDKKTLPSSVFEIKQSPKNEIGVFCQKNLPVGVQLGPVEGEIKTKRDDGSHEWQLKNRKLVYLQGEENSEENSNWMRHINIAENEEEHNLTIFQNSGNLYYKTTKQISAGDELLVFFSGVNTIVPKLDVIEQIFHLCEQCNMGFKFENYRDKHASKCGKTAADPESGFKCRFCGVTLTTQKFLEIHEQLCPRKNASGNPTFTSEDISSFVDQCEVHTSNKTDNKIRNCPYCDASFSSLKDLKIHEIRQHDVKGNIYECDKCSYKTVARIHFENHLMIHEDVKDENKLKCEHCNVSFSTLTDLKLHKIRQHDVKGKIYECDKCSYETVTRRHFEAHRITHGDVKDKVKLKCAHCSYFTYRKYDLSIHLRRHDKNFKFQCDKCYFSTVYKQNFQKHKKWHENNEQYKCTLCTSEFSRKQELRIHKNKAHPDLVPKATIFECPDCGYSCTCKRIYQNHRVKHGDVGSREKLKCPHCEYFTYRNKYDLASHIVKKHSKPHLCKHCKKRFTSLQKLTLHIDKMHKNGCH